MGRYHYLAWSPGLFLLAVSGLAVAGDANGAPEPLVDPGPSAVTHSAFSDCRRNRVTWSGGVARRGFDRIRPRPVRSRWQAAGESRIFCSDGDPFVQKRLSEEPWIR